MVRHKIIIGKFRKLSAAPIVATDERSLADEVYFLGSRWTGGSDLKLNFAQGKAECRLNTLPRVGKE